MEIVFTDGRNVQMPGQANGNDNAVCTANITKLTLVEGAAAGIAPNTGLNPVGVALEKGDAGEIIGYGTDAELAGFDPTGINPFDLVYPSAAVVGGMATGAEKKADSLPCGRVTGDGKRIKYRTL